MSWWGTRQCHVHAFCACSRARVHGEADNLSARAAHAARPYLAPLAARVCFRPIKAPELNPHARVMPHESASSPCLQIEIPRRRQCACISRDPAHNRPQCLAGLSFSDGIKTGFMACAHAVRLAWFCVVNSAVLWQKKCNVVCALVDKIRNARCIYLGHPSYPSTGGAYQRRRTERSGISAESGMRHQGASTADEAPPAVSLRVPTSHIWDVDGIVPLGMWWCLGVSWVHLGGFQTC